MRTSNSRIITLCGSLMFKDDFLREEKRLTLEGYVVFSHCIFDKLKKVKQIKLLEDLHKRKILIGSEILVINKGGYIGESTTKEIAFARKHRKIIKFMENEH